MTAQQLHRSRVSPLLILLAAIPAILLAVAAGTQLPAQPKAAPPAPAGPVEMPEPVYAPLDRHFTSVSDHCTQAHGGACLESLEFVEQNGKYCGGWCQQDGRDRWSCYDPSRGKWAILVAEGTRVITGWFTSKEGYANSIRDGCTPHAVP